jgi:hypothetical protein
MRKLPERQVKLPALPPSPDGMAAQKAQLCPDRVEPSRAAAPPLPATVLPLAPGRYKVQFTASTQLHDKLERLRELLRSKIPDGDVAAIIEEAVSEKLERLEARRFGQTKAPRTQLSQSDTSPGSRHIPAAVKRVVSERDGQRCRYQNQQGRRCPARSGLEFHHQYPFAFGGERGPDNIVLLCRPHHQLLAEHDYGATRVARQRYPDRRSSDPPSRRRSPSIPTSPP